MTDKYKVRMNGYYPQVIQSITEFASIIDSEHPEFEDFEISRERVLDDAYLTTMSEERITQWEKMLGIRPIEGSSVEDRRDTVMARIRGQGKLNTKLINTIVGTFTGGTANSWIEDSVLYVEITPPPNNKQYQFANVEQELIKKTPAHLGLQVSRNYSEWEEIIDTNPTWGDINNNFNSWEEVYLYVPFYEGGTRNK